MSVDAAMGEEGHVFPTWLTRCRAVAVQEPAGFTQRLPAPARVVDQPEGLRLLQDATDGLNSPRIALVESLPQSTPGWLEALLLDLFARVPVASVRNVLRTPAAPELGQLPVLIAALTEHGLRKASVIR